MSSGKKSNEQANAAVLGRRLRPIYDAIDAGQNKKAIQEADKVLKKHVTTAAAKALKALALIRTERNGEAWTLINALEDEVKEGKFDENLLQAMCHCFKEAFVPERIVLLYETMVMLYPRDEQHLTHLFMAQVRVRNYKQQHKVSMTLFKYFQSVPYYMWSVMSMVMQALTDPKLGLTMYLPLAEKMIEKILDGYKLQGEEVYLYLMILEGRNKLTSAIEFLEKDPSFDGTAMPGTSMKYKLNKLYQKANQHNVVVDRAMVALHDEYNDWTIWKCLFDSAFELLETEPKEEQKKIIKRLTEVCLNATLSTTQNKQQSQRGPLLARLELIDRLLKEKYLLKKDLEHQKLGLPLDSLKQLVKCSYTKPYCFADLKCYLHLLNDAEMQLLVEYVQQIYKKNYSKCAENESADVWCDILAERLTLFGQLTSRSITPTLAQAAVQRLFHKLPEDPCLGQEASAYAQLIANYFWFCYQQQQVAAISQCIVLLERVFAKYPNCDATVPLLLCRLYALLGGFRRVEELCKHLDIKYIQRDSMAYVQCLLGDRYGCFKSAILHYTSLGIFYDQSEREVSECIVNAYKNGHFSQIPKLCEFARKCSHSIYCAATDVMNRSLSSCFAIDSLDVVVEMLLGENDGQIEWEKVTDNRDFGMLASLTGIYSEADLKDVRQESFNELISTLKLHHYLCRAIGAFSHNQITKEKITLAYQEFTSHLESCQLTYKQPISTANRLEYFGHTQIRDLLHGGHLKLAMFVLNIGQTLVNKRFGESNQQNGNSLELVSAALPDVDKLERVVKSFVTICPDSMQGLPAYLEQSAKSLHFFVLSLVGFRLMENMLVSFGWLNCLAKNKRDKTKNSLSNHLSIYTLVLWNALKEMEQELKHLEERLKTGDYAFGSLQTAFETEENTDQLVQARSTMEHSLQNSYSQSISEMLCAIIKTKDKWHAAAISESS